MIDVKNMRDYTERVWFLGTDVVEESDLELLDRNVLARCWHPEQEWYPGNFYRLSPDTPYFKEYLKELKTVGYSHQFRAIMLEARKRGYLWVYFHPDIETEDASETPEEQMSVDELKNKYGGSGWDDHPDYDREDWEAEAEDNGSCVGYWEWVSSQIQMNSLDDD